MIKKELNYLHHNTPFDIYFGVPTNLEKVVQPGASYHRQTIFQENTYRQYYP